MKLWLTLQIVLILSLSGCAAAPIPLPDFEKAARPDGEVTDPVALPDLCQIPFTTADCYQRLDVYEDVATGNTKTAQLNADIARLSDRAYDKILSGAMKQQEIALIREDMLQAERRDHFIDNLWHRGLIILMAVGMVL